MRIDFTIDDCDVAVTTVEPTPLRPLVASRFGADDLWSGDTIVTDQLVGGPVLRNGTHLSRRPRAADPAPAAVVCLDVVAGSEAGRSVALGRGRLVLGRGAECDMVLADDRVSRRHAEIEVGPDGVRVRDLGSTNGTWLDGVEIGDQPVALAPGQQLDVGDCRLAVHVPDAAPAATTPGEGVLLVHRAPRSLSSHGPLDDLGRARTESDGPEFTDPPRPTRLPWAAALVPAAIGGALAWFTGSVQFLFFVLLSPITLLAGGFGDRVHWRRARRKARRRHQRAAAEGEARRTADAAAEAVRRRTALPGPAVLLRAAATPTSRLWERRRDDDDHLVLRLGCGDVLADMDSTGPPLRGVPVGIDLRAGPLGIAGHPAAANGLARWLITQLAVLHSPGDVHLALVLSPDRVAHWEWARWLPHLSWVASDPAGYARAVTRLAAVAPARHARPAHPRAGPSLVLLVDRAGDIAVAALVSELLASGFRDGLSAIVVGREAAALGACRHVAVVGGDTGTALTLRTSAATSVVADLVSPSWAERVARALAGLRDAGAEAGTLPSACDLIELMAADATDPAQVAARWTADSGRLDTVVGIGPDAPVRIDLLADGPHALVGGTTGSGKSELLRTLVLGLALAHPPDAVAFVLIDYKGGAAFGACADLPHVAGLITDLDPDSPRRALRSLRAELRRRESVLARAGVVDLDGYRRCAASTQPPLPRLVVVVDEFAALTDEQADFVSGIVAIAQRGRSLGIHLVLATQRPGTAITPEIRANTNVRIALRVTDTGESAAIIDAEHAATIDPATPGRAYLRRGSALMAFQTAHASGPGPDRTPRLEMLGPWRQPPDVPTAAPAPDRLARAIADIGHAVDEFGCRPAHRVWMPPLPRQLPLGPGDTSGGDIHLGRVDLPDRQDQPDLTLSLDGASSVLVAGRSGSGRTSALLAIAVAAATGRHPGELEIYLVDPGGTLLRHLEPLPHVVTALGRDGLGLVPELLRRLREAPELVTPPGGELLPAPPGTQRPPRLLLVDGWDDVLAAGDDLGATLCTDELAALLRVSATAGVTVAASGGRGVLPPRISAAFGERFVLDLTDHADYGLVGLAPAAVPAVRPAGRAVRASDGAECQFAWADPLTVPLLAPTASATASRSSTAISIRALPRQVAVDDLPAGAGLRLGRGGSAATPLDLRVDGAPIRMLVAGPPRSGRSTLLATLVAEANRIELPTIVLASTRSALATSAPPLGLGANGGEAGLGPPPQGPALLVMDDYDSLDEALRHDADRWLRDAPHLHVVVSARCDDLATSYRGLGATLRRERCGVLLRPGPVDGELFGLRLPRAAQGGPPGRGVVVGTPSWGPAFAAGEALTVQIATAVAGS